MTEKKRYIKSEIHVSTYKQMLHLMLQNSIIHQLGPPTVTQMTPVSIQQQSSNCNHKCIFNTVSQFSRADLHSLCL